MPLAAILTELGPNWENDAVRKLIAQWYWCGVFGELYGSAVKSRFALDIRDVPRWITGGPVPQSIERADFREERLRTLRTRLSAAYKGVHALLMRCGAEDLGLASPSIRRCSSTRMSTSIMFFPRHGANSEASSRKSQQHRQQDAFVGAHQPDHRGRRAIHLSCSARKGRRAKSADRCRTHVVHPDNPRDRCRTLENNGFDTFFNDRRERLLKLIEIAMGKPAVREDIAPPDPDDSFGEEEQEAERMEASESEVAA